MASEIGAILLARRFEAKVADAEKMRMAGLLASGVAHNFNNILQTITGQASLIEIQAHGNTDLVKASRMIIDVVDRGASLIRQLLSFTTSGAVARKVFAVNDLLSDSQELYRSIVGRETVVRYDLDQEAGSILADYSQIQQVITNLVVNSKEALRNSTGRVDISTRRVRLSSGEIDPELAPGEYIRIDISDDGVGMDQERRTRCFEPFFTTKERDAVTGISFSGSGLGLSTAFSYVKQHGGLITVESEIDRGTTFSVFLPIHHSTAAAKGEIKASESEPRALFLWQDLPSFFPLSYSLHGSGIAVESFSGDAPLLRRLEGNRNDVQVIVLDRTALNGEIREVLNSIRRSAQVVPIIIADGEGEDLLDAANEFEYIQVVKKPLDPQRFSQIVQESIGKRGLTSAIERLADRRANAVASSTSSVAQALRKSHAARFEKE
jgi:nitrogen-specific signal transduction histidine kinase